MASASLGMPRTRRFTDVLVHRHPVNHRRELCYSAASQDAEHEHAVVSSEACSDDVGMVVQLAAKRSQRSFSPLAVD
jgi:hypothetical protein